MAGRGNFLKEWFPEQTKSNLSILAWTVVFILDTLLVFWLAGKLGLNLMGIAYQLRTTLIMLLLVAALGLFWVETWVYGKFRELFR